MTSGSVEYQENAVKITPDPEFDPVPVLTDEERATKLRLLRERGAEVMRARAAVKSGYVPEKHVHSYTELRQTKVPLTNKNGNRVGYDTFIQLACKEHDGERVPLKMIRSVV